MQKEPDLDGTLLNSEKHIAEHTREVLTRAVEQGIWILPVTGRPLGGLPKEVVEFPGVQYAITANGARIMETQTGGCLYERLVPVKTAEQIMEIFSDYDALREVYYGRSLGRNHWTEQASGSSRRYRSDRSTFQ